jgi:glycosyltransferase involved in cell wall biosynthesis
MQILQFGVYPPPEGGVQTNVKDIRDYLRGQNIRCGVVHLSRHRDQDHDDIFYPKSPLAVIKRALSFPAPIWHFHLGGNATRELLGLYAFGTSVPGKKTVLTFHSGGYPSFPDAKRPNPVRDFIFRRFDRIIAVNQEIVEMFVRMGVRREKIRLISPFALSSQPPLAEIPEPITAFMSQHSPILIAVCGLEPQYDIALQIDAMAEVLELHPQAGLIVMGGGSLEGELRGQLASKPYSESIMLCGDVPRPVTLNVLTRSDIFLRTTWYDGDAVSVREALHFDIPVIASDNGMRPTGVHLVPARDAQALVTKISSLLSIPKRQRITKPGTVENLTAVLELYRELV